MGQSFSRCVHFKFISPDKRKELIKRRHQVIATPIRLWDKEKNILLIYTMRWMVNRIAHIR